MKLYTAFDLHSSNSYLAIIDEQGQRTHKKKLANDPEHIIEALKPYKERNRSPALWLSQHITGIGWWIP